MVGYGPEAVPAGTYAILWAVICGMVAAVVRRRETGNWIADPLRTSVELQDLLGVVFVVAGLCALAISLTAQSSVPPPAVLLPPLALAAVSWLLARYFSSRTAGRSRRSAGAGAVGQGRRVAGHSPGAERARPLVGSERTVGGGGELGRGADDLRHRGERVSPGRQGVDRGRQCAVPDGGFGSHRGSSGAAPIPSRAFSTRRRAFSVSTCAARGRSAWCETASSRSRSRRSSSAGSRPA